MDDAVGPSRIRRYALAGCSVFAPVGVQLALGPAAGYTIPLIASLLAVIITAYAGGPGPALFATAANLLVNCFYFAPPRLAITNSSDMWRLAAFTTAAVSLSLLSDRLPGTRYLPRVVLLLGSSLLLVIVSSLVWLDLTNARQAQGLVDHTYQVLNVSQELGSTIEDAETNQLDFLLTGEAQNLASFRADLVSEAAIRRELHDLTADNPSQRGRLLQLDRLIQARLALLDRALDVRRRDGPQAAIETVRSGAGARLPEQIRATLDEVKFEEQRLLTQRARAASSQSTRTRWVLAGGSTLLVILLVIGGITIENDVRRLKSSETILLRQADLLDKAPGPIIVFELDGAIEYWNHGAEELFGFSRKEAVGRNYSDLLHPIHPLGISGIRDLLVREGKWTGELMHWINGREVVVESHLTLVREPDGRQSVLKTNRDVTEEKRAQQEIRQLNRQLEQRVRERTAQLEATNKELQAFAYSVSHDLRAPLRGIDGWSLALLEDYGQHLDATGQLYLQRVRTETQRMGDLIDDLLKLSRLTRVELRRETVELSELASSIAARLQDAEPGRSIDFSIQQGLTTVGDSHLLEIMLSNLLSNAVKFTGTRAQARIEFGQTWRQGGAESGNAYYVRDNGVGFDMAYAGALFGAFQRLHKYTEFPGTGIGLAIAQRVLLRHGGRIWADAQPDQGATFYFTIGSAARAQASGEAAG